MLANVSQISYLSQASLHCKAKASQHGKALMPRKITFTYEGCAQKFFLPSGRVGWNLVAITGQNLREEHHYQDSLGQIVLT